MEKKKEGHGSEKVVCWLWLVTFPRQNAMHSLNLVNFITGLTGSLHSPAHVDLIIDTWVSSGQWNIGQYHAYDFQIGLILPYTILHSFYLLPFVVVTEERLTGL